MKRGATKHLVRLTKPFWRSHEDSRKSCWGTMTPLMEPSSLTGRAVAPPENWKCHAGREVHSGFGDAPEPSRAGPGLSRRKPESHQQFAAHSRQAGERKRKVEASGRWVEPRPPAWRHFARARWLRRDDSDTLIQLSNGQIPAQLGIAAARFARTTARPVGKSDTVSAARPLGRKARQFGKADERAIWLARPRSAMIEMSQQRDFQKCLPRSALCSRCRAISAT
jgi:hypothetical protein